MRSPFPWTHGVTHDAAEVHAVMDEYLTSAQYETLRGLRPGSSRAERARGGGPTYLKPTLRRVLYKKSAVIEWLERRSFTSTAEEKAANMRGAAA
jgi:hypothetical protein